jgi:hypothetical protein
LRAYHAGFTLKNGVPINYIEAISLFERAEVGFNTFYTYRDGESAWVYAQVLRLLNQLLGITCFAIDPYQIGLNNEEAIESGAFWFYRKLGFRPARPQLERLARAEEKKIKFDRGYRTSARTLRRLSTGSLVYEVPGSSVGDWDRFHIRNLALAAQRRLARLHEAPINDPELVPFEKQPLMLALADDLSNWSRREKRHALRIMRAKNGTDEVDYLRLLQRHRRMREAAIRIGSADC